MPAPVNQTCRGARRWRSSCRAASMSPVIISPIQSQTLVGRYFFYSGQRNLQENFQVAKPLRIGSRVSLWSGKFFGIVDFVRQSVGEATKSGQVRNRSITASHASQKAAMGPDSNSHSTPMSGRFPRGRNRNLPVRCRPTPAEDRPAGLRFISVIRI
jgi:hypothetical protein